MRTKTSASTSVRINVGLTRKCVDYIDDLIDETMLYNGRSEFVIEALRHFSYKFPKKASKVLELCIDKGGMTSVAMKEYNGLMASLGSTFDSDFAEMFGGTINVQVSIRISSQFYERLKGMFEMSPRGIQPLCRMAVYDYCSFIEKENEILQNYVDRYNSVLDEIEGRNAGEADVCDVMEIWNTD